MKLKITRRITCEKPYEFLELKAEGIKSIRAARRIFVEFEKLARYSRRIESLQDKHLDGGID